MYAFTALLAGSGNHRQGEGDGWKGLDATEKGKCKEPDNTAATLGNDQPVMTVWGEKSHLF